MMLSRDDCDDLGVVTALLAFGLTDAIFTARLMGSANAERGLAIFLIGLFLPAAYLLLAAFRHGRPPAYVLWLVLFLAFLVVEALLSTLLGLPTREAGWQVALYVVLFLGGLWGMVALAGQSGRRWRTVALVGFLSAVGLASAHFGVAGL